MTYLMSAPGSGSVDVAHSVGVVVLTKAVDVGGLALEHVTGAVPMMEGVEGVVS